MVSDKVKVFIGSGEASLLERKVLIYSLRKHSKRDLDIYVLNGSHNAVEFNDEPPFLAPMPLDIKYRNVTEFSLYRYLIPQLCEHQGRAIYVDSDTVCLADIGLLFDTSLTEYDFLAKAEAYPHTAEALWGLSVMLIDCSRCRFDLKQIFAEVDRGLYSVNDFSQMSQKFLSYHPYQIGEMNPNWNSFDSYDDETKLIHYTNLYTQPWKAPNHPYGELWFQYLHEAINAGYVTERDIELSLVRSYVRRTLMQGNSPKPEAANLLKQLKQKLRLKSRIKSVSQRLIPQT
jgi:lipopolysaccharide biosynthesis glycosyltransferase